MAAMASKDLGNAAFKSGDYPFALSHYSQAIKLDPSQPTFFLNRAAVHLKLQQWDDAEKDATSALEKDGKNPKALFRRAVARRWKRDWKRAKDDLLLAKECGAGAEVEAELKLLEAVVAKAKPATAAAKELSPKPRSPTPPSAKSPPPPVSQGAAAPKSSPSTSHLRAAISPPSSTSTNGDSPPNEFLKEVSTRRTPSSFADKKAVRDSRTGTTPFRLPVAVSGPPAAPSAPSYTSAPATHALPSHPSRPIPLPSGSPKLNHLPTPQHLPMPISVPSVSPPPPHSSPSRHRSPATSPPPHSLNRNLSSSTPSTSPPPPTSAAFAATWSRCSTPSDRRSFLYSLDPTTLPRLFGDRLDPDLFSEIVDALTDPEADADDEWLAKLRLLQGFPSVRRFGTAVGFLEVREREGLRELVAKVKAEVDKIAVAWEL